MFVYDFKARILLNFGCNVYAVSYMYSYALIFCEQAIVIIAYKNTKKRSIFTIKAILN